MRRSQRAPPVRTQLLVGGAAGPARTRGGDRDERDRHRPQQRAAGARRRAAARITPPARRRPATPGRRGGIEHRIQCSPPNTASASERAPRTRASGSAGPPAPSRAAARGRPGRSRGAPDRGHDGRAAGAPGHEAVAAGHLEHARRPATAPGTTSRQPPGVRPSPRGGRSTMRAETKTISPRRFCAAPSAGPTRRRRARAGRAPRARRAGRARPPARGGRRAAAARSRRGARSGR